MKSITTVTLIASVVAFASQAAGQTYWLNEDEGDWHVAANWSAGVPTSSTNTYINNGGRAHVGLVGGAARVLYLGQNDGDSGAVRISDGRLEAASAVYIGARGDGSVEQTGGEFVTYSGFCIGCAEGGIGAYELSGGSLLPASGEVVGSAGEATFTQTGGVNTVTGTLVHAYQFASAPTYSLQDGELTADSEVLGRSGTATFVQTGGVHTVTTDFYLGQGTNSLDNQYDLQGGDLIAGTEYLGFQGSAVLTQTSGTHTVEDTLWMGNINGEHYPDCHGVYNLIGGTLTVQGDLAMANEARYNVFDQTGGTATVELTLFVGYSGPEYTQASASCYLRGGRLEVGNLEVARNNAYGYFRLLSPDAYTQINGSMTLFARTVLQALPGVAIHLPGPEAVFHNEVLEETNLEPLRNVELVFEGGDTGTATFEVACVDYGATLAGYHDNDGNMALGTLTLGGADVGRVQLVNAYSNQGGADEALYVNTLDVGPNAYLDLNGLNLYYMHGQIDATATVVGGTPTRLLAGDYDGSGSVDLADYANWPDCCGGPGAEVTSDCWALDFDVDGDVDAEDFGGFQRAIGLP